MIYKFVVLLEVKRVFIFLISIPSSTSSLVSYQSYHSSLPIALTSTLPGCIGRRRAGFRDGGSIYVLDTVGNLTRNGSLNDSKCLECFLWASPSNDYDDERWGENIVLYLLISFILSFILSFTSFIHSFIHYVLYTSPSSFISMSLGCKY